MTPAGRAKTLLTMTLMSTLGALPAATRAADWQLASRMRAEVEHDSNPGLVPGGSRAANTAILGLTADGQRRTEAASTSVLADLALRSRSTEGEAGRVDGRFSLTREWRAETETWTLGFDADAGSAEDAGFGSADVLLTDAVRRSQSLSAGWLHRFTERWSAQAGATWTQANFVGQSGADYSDRGLSLQATYALDERSSASLSLSTSDYRSPELGQATTSSELLLSWTRRLSETSRMSIGLGGWQFRQESTTETLVCALPPVFCQLGLADPIPVPVTTAASTRGGAGSLRWEATLDERTSMAARASRDLSSGGAGVRRTDAVSLGLQRALGARTDAVLRLELTDAEPPGDAAGNERLDTLELRLSHVPAPGWRVGAAFEHRRSSSAGGPTADGNRVWLTLETDGPRLR